MSVEIATKQDVQHLLEQFFKKVTELIKNENPVNFQWLKIKDVQRLFGISPGKQRYMRERKELPFSKIGDTVYYCYADIHAILERNKQSAQ